MKKIIFSLALLTLTTQVFAQSWSSPSTIPPGGNTATPINEGSTGQIKNGSLSVNAFDASQNAYFAQKVGVGTVASTYPLDIGGNVRASGFFYASDRRLKENVRPLEDSLARIVKLQGVSFTWKKDKKVSAGLIAQDVEKVYPELVTTDSDGIKAVQYGNLIAPLIEAIKAQQAQIEGLKKEVAELKR